MVAFLFKEIIMIVKNEFITELEPRYCSNKSFYKKAYVEYYKGFNILISYSSRIMAVKGDMLVTTDDYNYSNTTSRHVHEFLKQYFIDLSSKDLGRLYKLNPWNGQLNDLDRLLD